MKAFWIVVVVVALIGLAVLVCCGGGLAVTLAGANLVADQVRAELEDNEALRKHIGEIEEFEPDLWSSLVEEDAEDVWVYEVRGTKGSGTITAEHITVSAEEEEVIWAKLMLPDGREIELVPEN